MKAYVMLYLHANLRNHIWMAYELIAISCDCGQCRVFLAYPHMCIYLMDVSHQRALLVITWHHRSHYSTAHMTALLTWHHRSHDSIAHMAAPLTWQHRLHNSAAYMTAPLTWQRRSHDITAHITAPLTWQHCPHDSTAHMTAPRAWQHCPHSAHMHTHAAENSKQHTLTLLSPKPHPRATFP